MNHSQIVRITKGVCDSCQKSSGVKGTKDTGMRYICRAVPKFPIEVAKPTSPCENYELSDRRKINAAIVKIRAQFPKSPEGRVFFAIIESAISDLGNQHHRHSARAFLRGDMPYAEICNVNSTWIKETVIKCGLLI